MRLCLAILIICLSGGCTTIQQLIGVTVNPPTVKLLDARLAGANFEVLKIDLILDIHNRNGVDLAFRNLKYKASVYDTKITEGEFKDQVVAKADAHTQFTVPLSIPVSQIASIAEKLLLQGANNAVLKLEAEAAFVTDAGDITVDFSDEKKLM